MRSAISEHINAAAAPLRRWRDERLGGPQHSDRVAAVLGLCLGISFTVCFVTGVLSHLIQHPPGWFDWPTRPAGLYRVTQGLHVTTGVAAIPLLFAKLWSAFPRLFAWPIFDDALHAAERLSLLPLVGGSLFMLTTGLANIELWYPWVFYFPAGHYAVSFVVMGSLVIHIVAKIKITRRALRREKVALTVDHLARRRFLTAAGAMSAGLVVLTAGQTVRPLRHISLLAPRRPDSGTQGFPVNKTAHEAGVTQTAVDTAYTLTVASRSADLRSFSAAELMAMPTRVATLPIACVEGWSASPTWRGVAVSDILQAAGVSLNGDVSVESLQLGGRYRKSLLSADQIEDLETMLAFEVDGEPLHLDHGYPFRLIAPNRPGVLQTKWVSRLVVQ